MFFAVRQRMLASMNETDWSELGVNGLPTGTVTLLLADVEGSTGLWVTEADEMTAAFERLDQVLSRVLLTHNGIRPVEQGEGDSFVIAFARASDALACALELQRAPLAPIRLRIGLHTGDVQLRDEGNYIGPTINRTARLRNLAHGGQTVLSGATEPLVVDLLPAGVWLTDLGTYPLRGMPRPERVVQLCHPDLHNDFPPLRTDVVAAAHNLPVQLTSFVGRQADIAALRDVVGASRLVTLTGAGGAGKTRLAVQVAAELAGGFGEGVCYVDFAPITSPEVVAVTVARALGLPDQPGRSTSDTLLRFVRDRHMLLVLDNCEHLLDSGAALVIAILGGAPRLTVLATSREPLNVPGEAIWQVPSLSLADDAVELFTDRARLVRSDFVLTDENADVVAEICRRLDGMPLAIELAAARARALSLSEILGGLRDRFRLLTGGSRTAVRRQQTLRASMDWSHALLTDPERILFRRLAVFLGGFDLDAARAVAGADGVQRYQVLDQLSLLVDKSLVVAENVNGRTRYRLLETMRQYALEKLGESGEADAIRSRHRDHYASIAALLDAPAGSDYERRIEQADVEMDNVRSAFRWCLENSDTESALVLASSLQPLWVSRGYVGEGLAWLEAGLGGVDVQQSNVTPKVRARALADKALLLAWVAWTGRDEADHALTIARELGDPALLIRALVACGTQLVYGGQDAEAYFAEAAGLARGLGDSWMLCQILGRQATKAIAVGDMTAARNAAQEALRLADAVGDRFTSRQCRWVLGGAVAWHGQLAEGLMRTRAGIDEATAAHDAIGRLYGLVFEGFGQAYMGDTSGARATAAAALKLTSTILEYADGAAYATQGIACLADGDSAGARQAYEHAQRRLGVHPAISGFYVFSALAPLACGDVAEARRWADDLVSVSAGCNLVAALHTRARVAITQGEIAQAERDVHDALSLAAETGAVLGLFYALECLAAAVADAGTHREAARLLGAADALRQHTGEARFKSLEADYQAEVERLREAMGANDFEIAWAEGAELSLDEAIRYAQRGRGERKRPASGWASLTPAELDVARLVREGLANKDIAARLFVSPRTVQTHLTHIFTKLGLTSRVQLAQAAAKHED